jgi:ATP-dependent protease HslVU (ClpYQ) peptidase subunit
MSCVIGIVKGKKVWLGAESCASTGDGERRYTKLKKIFKNGPYLIGFVGNVRPGQVVMPNWKPPKDIKDFPDALIEQFTIKGCIGTDSEDQTIIQGTNFLIAFKNRLYEILIDFQMNEIGTYSAIGSGSDFATGSLHTTSSMKFTPEKRITLALDAAVHHSTSCDGPYIIRTQPG